MLRAITFDHWGTLVDARHSNKQIRMDYFLECLPDADVTQLSAAWDVSWDRFHRILFEGVSPSASTFLSFVLEELDVSLKPARFEALDLRWREAMLDDPPPLIPGAGEVLETLASQGYRLGMISDTGVTPGAVLRKRLEQVHLLPYFDWLTFSDEIGVTKIRAYPFRHTVSALGVSAAHCLHVGDLPETDIRGGKRAGFRTALLLEVSERRDGASEADIVLERLTELPEALVAL